MTRTSLDRSSTIERGRLSAAHGLVALASLLVAGCLSTAAPERTAVMEDVGIDVTARQARLASQNTAAWVMSTIEITADAIADSTTSEQARVNSISWKANAIPAFQRAMFQSDPLVSFVDGWTLIVQMRQYLETGIGKDLFGDRQYMAIDAVREMEQITDESVESRIQPETWKQLSKFVYKWAEENPLDNHLFQRRSIGEQVMGLLAKQEGGGLSQLGSMAQMAEDAQHMALTLASYAPKEIRWQSELMMANLADSSTVAELMDTIQELSLVEATTELIQGTPELIAEERLAVLSEVERQRLETLTATMALLQSEREILLRDVGAMIAEERQAIMASAEALTIQAFGETRGVIDHLMRWVVILGGGVVVLIVAGFAIVMRYLYTRGGQTIISRDSHP
jgi:hypothetical protein